MSDALQPLQLDLFDELPAQPRLPRRLRRLGFERQLVGRDIARLEELLMELAGYQAEMALEVSEAKAHGRVLAGAYSVAVKAEAARDEARWKLKDLHDLARGLEQQISVGVERLLAQ